MSYVHHQQQQDQQQHHEQHHVGEDDGASVVSSDRQHLTAAYDVDMDEGNVANKQIITAEIITQPTAEQQSEATTVTPLETNQSMDGARNGDVDIKDSRSQAGDQEDDLIGDISYGDRSMLMRDGRPHKYPALKQYYEFGAWVGRNRKAICVSCRHQSASSQPERLIRHLKRCPALSEHDRSIADDLLAETMANKKTGRPPNSSFANQLKGPNRSFNDSHNSFSADVSGVTDHEEHNNSVVNTTNNNDASANESGTPNAVNSKPATKRQRVFAESKNRIDEALTRFIMVNRIPLKSISSREFVEFVRFLNPDYRIPTQGHITNVLIPGLLNII